MEYPDSDQAFARLQPVFPALYEALEHGTGIARNLFEDWDRPEPHLFAGLARYHAIPVLDARGRRLDGYARVELTNSGIQLAYGGYDLRVWKTSDGELPNATTAKAKLFVRQLTLDLRWANRDDVILREAGNLIVQWEYDSATGRVDLTLVCPKPGQSGPESVEAYWSRPIPHPAETISGSLHGTPAIADTVDDDGDLEFIRRKASSTAAESS